MVWGLAAEAGEVCQSAGLSKDKRDDVRGRKLKREADEGSGGGQALPTQHGALTQPYYTTLWPAATPVPYS